jgi:hypothetical protein
MKSKLLRWLLGSAAVLMGAQVDAGGFQAVEPTASALSAAPNAEVVVGAAYTTSDANPALTGLGLRIHFNSAALHWIGFDDLLQRDLVGADTQPMVDSADYDGDPGTDAYVTVAWAAPAGGWPGTLPSELLAARFQASGTTTVRFSASATAVGYGFRSGATAITVRR